MEEKNKQEQSGRKKTAFRISRRLATIDFMAGAFLLFLAVRSALRSFGALSAEGFTASALLRLFGVLVLGGVGVILLSRVTPRLVKANLEDLEAAEEKEAAEKAEEQKKSEDKQ